MSAKNYPARCSNSFQRAKADQPIAASDVHDRRAGFDVRQVQDAIAEPMQLLFNLRC